MIEIEDLSEPIPGDNPSGANLRYDSVYLDITEARRADADLPRNKNNEGLPLKKADWRRVAKLASAALKEQSRDLQLAGWLSEALLHTEGFVGLRRGFQTTTKIVTDFWETAYPELDGTDADFRAGPLNWIGSQLELPIKSVPLNSAGHTYHECVASLDTPTQEEADAESPSKAEQAAGNTKADRRRDSLTPEDAEAGFLGTEKAWYKALVVGLEESLAELKQLEEECDKAFKEFDQNDGVPPSFSNTLAALNAVHELARGFLGRKLESDPDPVELSDGSSDEVTVSDATPVSGPPKSNQDACNRILIAARFLREEDSTNPGPYLMVRGLRWGELRAGGGVLDPRLLAAPPTVTRTRLKGMLLDGSWAALIEAGEEVTGSPFGRGWLDLQRYILTAMGSLGGAYEPAREAIRGALRTLLMDVPDLLDATLMDDTPTANRETRAWLGSQGLIASGEEAGGAPGASESAARGNVGPMGGALRRGRSEARAGRHEQAIRTLQDGIGSESTQRGKFLLRTEAASVMIDAGHYGVALPMLLELYEEVSREQSLITWEESSVMARPMALLYQCALSANDRSVDTESLYLEICRLDPVAAIELKAALEEESAEPVDQVTDKSNG